MSVEKRRDYIRRRSVKRRNTRLDLILKLGGRCVKCGETELGKLELDHIKPVYCNGNRSHTWKDLTNLQVLCRHCNAEKSDKTVKYC